MHRLAFSRVLSLCLRHLHLILLAAALCSRRTATAMALTEPQHPYMVSLVAPSLPTDGDVSNTITGGIATYFTAWKIRFTSVTLCIFPGNPLRQFTGPDHGLENGGS